MQNDFSSCSRPFPLRNMFLLLHYPSSFQQVNKRPVQFALLLHWAACLQMQPFSVFYRHTFVSPMSVVTLQGEPVQTCCRIFCAHQNQFQKMWVKHDNIFASVCVLCHSQPDVLQAATFFANHRVCVCQTGRECQLNAEMCHVLTECLFISEKVVP